MIRWHAIRPALVLPALLLLALPAGAEAQRGFALKGGAVFNHSAVSDPIPDGQRIPDATGFSLGAELVLPAGLGVGISGYTAGGVRDFDTSTGSLVVLGEANYFLRLPGLPLAPYAGLHVGLGRYDLDQLASAPRPDVNWGDVGYQFGVRLQPAALLGIDAQYRRVSGSLQGLQDARFETDQLLVGLTLF